MGWWLIVALPVSWHFTLNCLIAKITCNHCGSLQGSGCLQNPLYVLTLPKFLQSLPHTWINKQLRAVPAGSANDTVPTVGISGPTPFLSAAADTEEHSQDKGISVCYREIAGLIPFPFKKGLEAILPRHEHPCVPHLNSCSQLRSSISEGIQPQPHLPATPLQFWASSCIRWSHLAVLPPPERKQHPRLLLEERNRSTARLPACTEGLG